MSETEQVFGSREVATLLGLGSAMLRRYAVAYEKATGTQLDLDRRDGRMFTQQDVEVLIKTRNLVASKGLPVDKAVEMALAQPKSVPKPLGIVPAASGEALAAVLSQAITEAQRPLLGELQSINLELQAVRAELTELRQGQREPEAPLKETEVPSKELGDKQKRGLLVRVAVWIEQRLRKDDK